MHATDNRQATPCYRCLSYEAILWVNPAVICNAYRPCIRNLPYIQNVLKHPDCKSGCKTASPMQWPLRQVFRDKCQKVLESAHDNKEPDLRLSCIGCCIGVLLCRGCCSLRRGCCSAGCILSCSAQHKVSEKGPLPGASAASKPDLGISKGCAQKHP